MNYKVAIIENHPEAVRKVILSKAPENYEITFAESYEKQYLINLINESDFVLFTGVGPDIDMEYIKDAKKLKLVQKWGIGVDKVPVKAAKELGIPVAITAGANAVPVAEMTVCMMLSAMRRIPILDQSVRDGKWLKSSMRDTSHMLHSRTIGIIGMGFIARRVAHLLQSFDVNIIYYDVKRAEPEVEKELKLTYVEFDEVFAQSDLVTIHIPLIESTRGIVTKKQFDLMKPTAFFVNIARGAVVREADLIDALKNKKIAGAGIDVYEDRAPEAGQRAVQAGQRGSVSPCRRFCHRQRSQYDCALLQKHAAY